MTLTEAVKKSSLSWNPKVHSRIQTRPLLTPILSQLNALSAINIQFTEHVTVRDDKNEKISACSLTVTCFLCDIKLNRTRKGIWRFHGDEDVFSPEDGDSMFLRNAGIYLPKSLNGTKTEKDNTNNRIHQVWLPYDLLWQTWRHVDCKLPTDTMWVSSWLFCIKARHCLDCNL
jgi:hypothetical protein